ncbi:unnamed protein product [Prorocentrum cordatum]|uniref:Uncharacterized protein n=1 Tax=Prorocentrum cordatum TaxID=2364126 RepID=A0ABN9VX20_9DINO|nr:unnamed protein product [Polarella glacialis]
MAYVSWRALSCHTTWETIYYNMGILYVRVGRAPPRKTYRTSMSLCVPRQTSALVVHGASAGSARRPPRRSILASWYSPSSAVQLSRNQSAVEPYIYIYI